METEIYRPNLKRAKNWVFKGLLPPPPPDGHRGDWVELEGGCEEEGPVAAPAGRAQREEQVAQAGHAAPHHHHHPVRQL